MNLISNSMNKWWKLSFVAVFFWALVILAENWAATPYVEAGWDGAELLIA